MFAKSAGQLPFDVALLRAVPSTLGPDRKVADPVADGRPLTARLLETREATTDSPVYQLVEGFPDIQRLKTDVFRDRVIHHEEVKSRLAALRKR